MYILHIAVKGKIRKKVHLRSIGNGKLYFRIHKDGEYLNTNNYRENKMDMNETIRRNIIRQRKSVGLTRNELAEKLDVSPDSVVAWENGYRFPSKKNLKKICECFGLVPYEIYHEINEENCDEDAMDVYRYLEGKMNREQLLGIAKLIINKYM